MLTLFSAASQIMVQNNAKDMIQQSKSFKGQEMNRIGIK